jgi:hypothetical protein
MMKFRPIQYCINYIEFIVYFFYFGSYNIQIKG